MKIAALLSVKDEVELVGRSIEHLRAIGVDDIVVRDMGSTDGSLEILQQYRSDDFRLVEVDVSEPLSLETWTRQEIELVRTVKADWVIFLDADELWIPRSGRLRDCAALAQGDVLSVRRFNVCLGAGGPCIAEPLEPSRYPDLLLYVDAIPDFREHLQRSPDTPWIRGVPMPKIMTRPECIDRLTAGQHDVIAGHDSVRRTTPDDLLIAHLPFTTVARFHRKIDNLRQSLALHEQFFTGHVAWHWRRWLALDDQRQIDEEFRRQVLADDEIVSLRQSGVIRSAADVLAASAEPTGASIHAR